MRPPQFIDSHCHLDYPAFTRDLSDVLSRAHNAGVSQLIIAGVAPAGWARQKALAQRYAGIHYTIGIHPWSLNQLQLSLAQCLAIMTQYLEQSCPPLALGEVGLDRSKRCPTPLETQISWMTGQIDWAQAHGLPLVLHVVRAHGKAREILKSLDHSAGGVVHGFHGSWEVARDYLDLGFYIGLNGGALRQNGQRMTEVIRRVPLDRLLLESDAPDQHLDGGGQRNEPSAIIRIAELVAAKRPEQPANEILIQAANNARRLFALDSGLKNT